MMDLQFYIVVVVFFYLKNQPFGYSLMMFNGCICLEKSQNDGVFILWASNVLPSTAVYSFILE